ncbi:MAG: sugar ABC transporter ATP-binding protein [Phycisphaerales bacterium]|nr:MAG: sugar ABC transporter ATP-binding protein [Phycisphaerales bacterium]
MPTESEQNVPPLVQMTGITKRFGHVTVLHEVSFDVRAGEVHVLAGENGAGKSTLIKILAGVHSDFEGAIEIEGKPVRPASPLEANALGVAVIHQELSLVPSMSVADNIFLGRSVTHGGFVSDRVQRDASRDLMARFGINVDVDQLVEDLPIATQQLIEIAKALSHEAKIIVMDEPTSALSAPEVEKLFGLIAQLKERGCGIVYISHKMEEIERIADRITVLRDGRFVGCDDASALPVRKIINWMVGRDIEQQFPRHTPGLGSERLRIEDFTVPGEGRHARPVVDGASLHVRAGEIVSLAGLQGSGASELLWGIFGARGRNDSGRVLLDGAPLAIRSPHHAISNGIALLTNDRKATGLVLSMSVIANAVMADLPRLSPLGLRSPAREMLAADRTAERLNLRAASLQMEVNELSGGNQQKVALAKWMQTEPKLLLLDEPTRGIDVGAKREVYQLMNDWTARGIAILMITSELPELLAMSDRIVVMHRGRITAHYTREEATADAIMEAAMGRQMETMSA